MALGISAGWLGHEASSKSKHTKTLPTSRSAAQYISAHWERLISFQLIHFSLTFLLSRPTHETAKCDLAGIIIITADDRQRRVVPSTLQPAGQEAASVGGDEDGGGKERGRHRHSLGNLNFEEAISSLPTFSYPRSRLTLPLPDRGGNSAEGRQCSLSPLGRSVWRT